MHFLKLIAKLVNNCPHDPLVELSSWQRIGWCICKVRCLKLESSAFKFLRLRQLFRHVALRLSILSNSRLKCRRCGRLRMRRNLQRVREVLNSDFCLWLFYFHDFLLHCLGIIPAYCWWIKLLRFGSLLKLQLVLNASHRSCTFLARVCNLKPGMQEEFFRCWAVICLNWK